MAVISAPNTLPRGVRNNNPLNIEYDVRNKWLGQSATPSDGRFCRFESMDYGVRAAALLLMKYQDRDGLRTVRGIVSKWAPAAENNVAAYVASVCSYTGFTPDQPLDLHQREDMEPLLAAMGRHETGMEVNVVALNKGLALAGFPAPTNVRSVAMTPTMIAASISAAPAITVGAAAVIDGIIDQSDLIPGIVTTLGGPAAGGIALGVVTALTWLWNLYKRLQTRQETGV